MAPNINALNAVLFVMFDIKSGFKYPTLLDPKTIISGLYGKFAIWTTFCVCDEGVNDDAIKRLTKKINGGHTGLDHRIKETKKVYEWVK